MSAACNLKHLGKAAMLIERADSRQPTNEWVKLDAEGKRDFCRWYSVGFIVQDDKDVIALAANVADVGDEAQATGVIVIPRVAVLKQTALTSCSSSVSKPKLRRS